MPKIYTKTGDSGTTSLYDGTRMGKDSIYFDILGNNDELTSRIGIIYTLLKDNKNDDLTINISDILRDIQSTIQDINSNIAKANVTISEDKVIELEKYIDIMTKELPPLTKFILPGENFLDANIHLCRTQTRKVERELWLMNQCIEIDKVICKYINRLSDFFFTLARWTISNDLKGLDCQDK